MRLNGTARVASNRKSLSCSCNAPTHMDRAVEMPSALHHDKGVEGRRNINDGCFLKAARVTAIDRHLLDHDIHARQRIVCTYTQGTDVDLEFVELGNLMGIIRAHPAWKIRFNDARCT